MKVRFQTDKKVRVCLCSKIALYQIFALAKRINDQEAPTVLETPSRISSALRLSMVFPLGALLLLAGCPKTPVAGGPPPTKDEILPLRQKIEGLRLEAEELHQKQAESIWLHLLEGEPMDVSSLHDEHPDLFSTDSLRAISRLRLGTTDPDEQFSLELLESHFLAEHLGRITKELNDRQSAIEANATMEVEGHMVPYRDAGRLLAHENDWYRRRAIHQSTLPMVEALSPILRKKHELISSTVSELGYESLLKTLERERRVDVANLSRLAREVLDGTEEIYLSALSHVAEEELGIKPDRLGWADIPRLFRGGHLDRHFDADGAMTTLRETLEGMGLTSDAGGRILVAKNEDPRKAMGPVCLPVDVPNDIRLLVAVAEGLNGYGALFREMGHAKRLAGITERGFEQRYLGDSAVANAFALLFEGLPANPLWLSDRIASANEDEPDSDDESIDEDIDRAARLHMLERVFLARRHAANVLFQLAMASEDLDGHASPRSLYAAMMEEAYGFSVGPYDSARWAFDQNDLLLAADHLRAHILAAQLEEHLTAEHGDRWWKTPAAGAWMRELWTPGARLEGEDLAKETGASSLKPDSLTARMACLLDATAPKE